MARPMVVVVTGASAGVGRATVRAFARRGAKIGLLARGREALEATAEEVRALGGEALPLVCDVAEDDAVEAAAEAVEMQLGSIDVWINNAGVSVFSPVHRTRPDEYQRVTHVNYLGAVYGTLAALKRMRQRDRGVVLQVGGYRGLRGFPLQSADSAAKHAIVGFCESLRAELLHEGSRIKLVEVYLPSVNTPQYEWSRSHVAARPRPIPPVYEPEVAAAAIVRAALHPSRCQVYVGSQPSGLPLANHLAPRLVDRRLGGAGWDLQLSSTATLPDDGDNLFDPVRRDYGSSGPFLAEAKSFDIYSWATGRGALLFVALAVLGSVIALLASITARAPTPPRRRATREPALEYEAMVDVPRQRR